MKAVVIGSDTRTTTLATLATRLCWPGAMPVVGRTGARGVELVAKMHPDLVLMHPDFTDKSLLETVQEVRTITTAPLIVLGYCGNQMELATALTAGADHYVKLPCTITELTARVWATLRRTGVITTAPKEAPLRSGDKLLLNLTTREAVARDKNFYFTPPEFRLLRELLEETGPADACGPLDEDRVDAYADGHSLVKSASNGAGPG